MRDAAALGPCARTAAPCAVRRRARSRRGARNARWTSCARHGGRDAIEIGGGQRRIPGDAPKGKPRLRALTSAPHAFPLQMDVMSRTSARLIRNAAPRSDRGAPPCAPGSSRRRCRPRRRTGSRRRSPRPRSAPASRRRSRSPAESATPMTMPAMPPVTLRSTASARNCSSTCSRRAPIAMRRPISRVRSVTDTSRMFMMPMPPTTQRDRGDGGEQQRHDAALLSAVSAIWLRLRTEKSLSAPGLMRWRRVRISVTWPIAGCTSGRRCRLHEDLVDEAGQARRAGRRGSGGGRIDPVELASAAWRRRGDAEHLALRGGERDHHQIVLVLAERRLALGREHADHAQRHALDLDQRADRILVGRRTAACRRSGR